MVKHTVHVESCDFAPKRLIADCGLIMYRVTITAKLSKISQLSISFIIV